VLGLSPWRRASIRLLRPASGCRLPAVDAAFGGRLYAVRVKTRHLSGSSPALGLGAAAYTDDGGPVGTVWGFDGDSLYVTARDGIESLSIEHERSGHEFEEAGLVWRCSEYGKMAALGDSFPGECPNCGTEREAICYY